MKTLFKEEQKFNQWWLWLIVAGTGIIALYGIYAQFILEAPFGSNPSNDTALIIFAFTIFIVIALLFFMRLRTEIDQNEIRMNYFPFVKKKVNWKDVMHAEVVNYGFIGGWGIRLWTKYGTVYNTSGNKGLAIILTNGKKFLIGTQKETELKAAIAAIGAS